jgi:hypothetical protein
MIASNNTASSCLYRYIIFTSLVASRDPFALTGSIFFYIYIPQKEFMLLETGFIVRHVLFVMVELLPKEVE